MALLFFAFFLFLLTGMPVSFSLLTSSILYMVYAGIPFSSAIQSMIAGVDSFPLLAVSFFILAGNVMNKGGITTRIFNFVGSQVNHRRGGLAHANVIASVIFSGMSGSAIADTGGLGAIELKAMRNAGYSDDFSLAVTGASSIIGPIIPPSIPVIIFAVSANASVGRLFIAGIIPGLLLALMMGILNYIICAHQQYTIVPKAGCLRRWELFRKAFFPLLTPFIILFGIISGIYTATEAAIVAVVYALLLGLLYRDIRWSSIAGLLKETLLTTTGVLLVVAAANVFGRILVSEQVPQKLAGFLLQITDNKYLLLLIINIFVLFVGLFLDVTPAILILTPVFAPVLAQYGIDVVHFGIIFILNLMIGLLTPPIGMVLFVLSNVAKVSVEKIARAIFPYVLGCIMVLLIVTYIPALATWLPGLAFD